MSAHRDRSQKIAFFYGNAMKNLAPFLPTEKQELVVPGRSAGLESVAQQEQIRELERLLDRSQLHLEQLRGSQREIAYLLGDLKRLL